MRIYNVQTDLTQNTAYEPLRYKQYDNGSELEIEIYNSDERVNLTSETIIGYFQLINGVVIQKNCSIKNGNILATLDNNILSANGKVLAEFSIIRNGKIDTTSTLYLDVEKSIDRNTAIESIPQWDIVDRLLDFDAGKLLEEIKALKDTIAQGRSVNSILEGSITEGIVLHENLVTEIDIATSKKNEIENIIATADLKTYATREEINEVQNVLGLLPVDGGTFFEEYIEYSRDGGTF